MPKDKNVSDEAVKDANRLSYKSYNVTENVRCRMVRISWLRITCPLPLWVRVRIPSCSGSIQLVYRTLVVLLMFPLVPEIDTEGHMRSFFQQWTPYYNLYSATWKLKIIKIKEKTVCEWVSEWVEWVSEWISC